MSAPEIGRPAGERDRDAGDTLLEILISVAILGIVGAALIGGFLIAISNTSVYRAVADADTVLRTAVDSITTNMQQNPSAAFSCTPQPNFATSSIYNPSLPAGFTESTPTVEYWVSGTASATCSADAPQLISLAVTYKSASAHSTSKNSATFAVNDPQAAPTPNNNSATQLAFLSSGGPSDTTAGGPIPNQPLVAVEDAAGHIVTTDLSPVTLTITAGSGTPGAQLENCTGTEFYGVVNFKGCEIDVAGSGYTLTATDPGLTSATSPTFTVNPGPAATLVFSQSPVTTSGNEAAKVGVAFGRQPVATLLDAYGNIATLDASTVALSITSGTGTPGANLTCNPANNQQPASSGLATFSGCSIDTAGTGYTLTATDASDGLTATSIAFRIDAGPPAKLVFTTEPGGTITGGSAFPNQPVVTIEDAGGHTVTSDNSSVDLTITPNSGAPGAALTCSSNPAAASSGVATFSGCSINTAASGYTLTATDATDGLTVTSSGFVVGVGPAAQLIFTTEPGGTITAGSAFAIQPVVTIKDAGGNTVTSDTSTVALAITAGTGTSGASLTCNPSSNRQAATAGVATFSGCAINKSGSGYTLTATDATDGLTVTSSSFPVSAGAAVKLVFTTEPGGTITGGTAFPTQPIVTIEDAGGNTVTSNTSTVKLTLNPPTGITGATLTCNPSNDQQAATAGVATFSGCAINKAATGYTITATDGTLTATTSVTLTVGVGPAAQLVFTQEPGNASGTGQALSTQPQVTIEDAGGNTETGNTSSVTLTLNPPSGVSHARLTCSSNPLSATNGVATFSNCSVNKAGNGFTLTATDGTLTSATSTAFNV
jgi:trimeric autotransporter adhesin